MGPFVSPDERPSSKQKAPRGKETHPSKFVLRKRRNKVPKHLERHAREKDFPARTVRTLSQSQPTEMRYLESITDNLSKAGWIWGCVSAADSWGRIIWIADAHRGDGKRYIVRADEKLTAFLELERAVCIHLLTEQI